ncbi:hypothetical protein [Candidatus Mycoplasma mahonii]|uniref:hypothetical protein n=1 Tax=Candidatus Mycoplasma mahonii TaxID=3004105 RepID=UPI0026ECE21F|nr:hypothetical protein [Candidatus Mycoplasma mahonii]WKX02816.1 hypothetical protein O3I44_01955 [Candidatus Mycoplasma mahonii]
MEKNILIISFAMLLLGMVIFGSLWTKDSSWILGWMVGAPASIIGYLVGMIVLTIILRNKSKAKGMWLTLFRVIITFLFQAILFIGIILINKRAHGINLWSGRDLNIMFSPINLFTYLSGVGIIAISTFAASMPIFTKGK